jgi:hypothetical protein
MVIKLYYNLFSITLIIPFSLFHSLPFTFSTLQSSFLPTLFLSFSLPTDLLTFVFSEFLLLPPTLFAALQLLMATLISLFSN